MSKGLYFTAVVFLSFRCLISEVTERISTKLGNIFTYDCYLKNLVQIAPCIYPHGLGAKNAFLAQTLNFGQTYLCNGTRYQLFARNLLIYSYSLTYREIWWIWSTNGWERLASFCPPSKLLHSDTVSLTAWTLYNKQQVNFGTCYIVARADCVEQQNAGRAYAGLCHAFSLCYIL